MLKINRYKLYNKFFFLKNFNTRLLKFKHEKWFDLQNRLKARIKRQEKKVNKRKARKRNRHRRLEKQTNENYRVNKCLSRILNIKKKIRRWDRQKKRFSKELSMKRLLFIIYDRSIKLKFWREQTKTYKIRENLVGNFLIKPYFRLDILLWFLGFFSSSYQVRQFCRSRFIFLNGVVTLETPFLKRGDLVIIDSLAIKKSKKLRRKYSSPKIMLTFLEVDYYMWTVNIVGEISNLSNDDYLVILRKYFNLKSSHFLY